MFEADELRTILAAAKPQMRAMILLGCNTGFGVRSVSTLPLAALDLDRGWVDYPRPKTAVTRRCPLWPETIEAIRLVLQYRRPPKRKANADLVFLTPNGATWQRRLTLDTTKLLRKLGLHRSGRGFYCLRHTFETIGGDARDQIAVDHIMGHSRNDMASVYREHISDERLRAVTDHVHAWLFGEQLRIGFGG